MSASREKKQRQGAAPSDKAAQTHSEQAAYKRKVRTYTAIGIVVVVLVAALLTWNSGFFQSRASAATVGSNTLSASELSYYYYDARYMYAALGMIDRNTPDDEQIYDEEKGTTYRDFFLETALENAQNSFAMYDAAIKAGYSVADIQEDLDAQIQSTKDSAASQNYSYSAFLRAMYGKYMTTSVYENILSRTLLATLYYNDTYGEKSDSFTDEDLEAYYKDHADEVDTIEYSYLYFKAETVSETDEDGNELSEEEITALKEEAMAAAKEKAEEALASYEDGTTLAKLITQTEPDNSADHTSVVGTSALSTVYKDELLKLGEDEAAVVESEDTGYYVVVFHSRGKDESTPATIRDILIQAETTTDDEDNTVAPTDEAWEAAKAKAEEVMAKWESGEKTADAFAALAEEYSASSTAANGGLSNGVTEGSLSDDRNAWLFEEDRTAGDVTMVKHEGDTASSTAYWGYHITYFQEWEEASWKQDVRQSLTEDAMTELTDSLLEGDAYATSLLDGANSLGR